jgi:hypothetical protein
MDSTDYSAGNRLTKRESVIDNKIREEVMEHSKNFKISWINLGRTLHAVWQDKMFHAWGFEKFEHYCSKEVGLKKELSLRLLKTYFFVEQEEPAYLKEEFSDNREAIKVPGYEEVNVLRLAKQKKELTKDDYNAIRKAIFDKGKDASGARKDLTQIMKERKEVDPEEERDLRNQLTIRKLLNSLRSFKKDAQALKLVPEEVINEAEELIGKLEKHLD